MFRGRFGIFFAAVLILIWIKIICHKNYIKVMKYCLLAFLKRLAFYIVVQNYRLFFIYQISDGYIYLIIFICLNNGIGDIR